MRDGYEVGWDRRVGMEEGGLNYLKATVVNKAKENLEWTY